jgi:quinoprotein glucose dehydrogenase
MVSITSAPTIVRGVIVTGHQVLDGQRRDAPSGVIQGYRRRHRRPALGLGHGASGHHRPAAQGQIYTKGTPNMWTTASGDEALGLVYLPLGVAPPTIGAPAARPGEAVLDLAGRPRRDHRQAALEASRPCTTTSGTTTWARRGRWSTSPPPAGRSRRSCCPANRATSMSWTGAPASPSRGRGASRAARRRRAPSARPTQPFSLFHTLRKPDLTEKQMWGMSPIDQMICRIQFRRQLRRLLHPADGRPPLHRISRLQRRVRLGRHRRRPGAAA